MTISHALNDCHVSDDSSKKQIVPDLHLLSGVGDADWRKIHGITGMKGADKDPSWLPSGIEILGCGKDESPFSGMGDRQFGLPRHGFQPDENGMDQKAVSRSESTLGKAWDEVKSIFGFGETVADRVKEGVEKRMSPAEQEQLHKEELEYENRRLQWMTQSTLNPGPMPDVNDYPMIVKRDQMVRDAEQQIVRQVRENMSPSDRELLDRDRQEYERKWDEYTTITNPYGTGEGFRPAPKPSAQMKAFQERVAKAVEQFDS